MRYMVEQKQKLLSLSDRFFIKDESGQIVYEAMEERIGLGANVSLKSPDGRKHASIKQKLALTPTYQLFMDGELAGTLKRVFFSWRRRYKLLLPGGSAIDVKGFSRGPKYEILLEGTPLGSVSRKWLSWRDTYGVEVSDESKTLLILTMVVALDLSFAAERQTSSS